MPLWHEGRARTPKALRSRQRKVAVSCETRFGSRKTVVVLASRTADTDRSRWPKRQHFTPPFRTHPAPKRPTLTKIAGLFSGFPVDCRYSTWDDVTIASFHVSSNYLFSVNPLKSETYFTYSGQYMYRTVVTICTAHWSLYVPHIGHYMYRTVVTICTTQWSLYVPHSGHYMYHQL